ncbi:hypothetical protein HMPREF1981_02481 [Bacteroides pyogenes F0041]|uniref:Uncharacterized protein n=1 Tax=Bacteroides pyogenes F0041 TaxID=1321819 RepID=U2DRF8_9BACE|nr:hypothetical protein HMPREF1981_02481 [Bacteroides pyogenes F0041]
MFAKSFLMAADWIFMKKEHLCPNDILGINGFYQLYALFPRA